MTEMIDLKAFGKKAVGKNISNYHVMKIGNSCAVCI